MTFPILISEKLTLRQLSIDDQDAILALRSDPKVNRYLDRAPTKTVDDAINFNKKVNENIEKGIALYWAITLTETNTFVGTICLFDFSTEKKSCEVGYELMTSFRGQGIMSEAVQMVINFAFKNLHFKEISAFSHKENQPSLSLLNKFNFVKSEETDIENPNLEKFSLRKYTIYSSSINE